MIHDGSSRCTRCIWKSIGYPGVAPRDGQAQRRGREAYLKQYVDRLSGEHARRQACRSSESGCPLLLCCNGPKQQKRSRIMRDMTRIDIVRVPAAHSAKSVVRYRTALYKDHGAQACRDRRESPCEFRARSLRALEWANIQADRMDCSREICGAAGFFVLCIRKEMTKG
jgi:hypothetical protein